MPNVFATQRRLDRLSDAKGLVRSVAINPPLAAGQVYAAGHSLGGLLTFADMARPNIGSGLIQNVALTSLSGQTPEVDLVFFNALPQDSTIADRTAVSIVAADLGKIVGYAKLSLYIQLGTPTLAIATQQAIAYRLAAGTSLYAAAITRTSVTFSSGSGLRIVVSGLLD